MPADRRRPGQPRAPRVATTPGGCPVRGSRDPGRPAAGDATSRRKAGGIADTVLVVARAGPVTVEAACEPALPRRVPRELRPVVGPVAVEQPAEHPLDRLHAEAEGGGQVLVRGS